MVQPFGAMLTFGGHKGYGLAVACELLGGALTGGGTWHYDESKKQRVLNGMLTIVIDPARLGTRRRVRAARRASSSSGCASAARARAPTSVRIAGEPERETAPKRERDGISVDDNTWKEILAAAAKLKTGPKRVEALAQGG